MLNLGLITDIHFGPDRGTKRGSLAPELFPRFAEWAEQTGVERVIDLGDRISDVDREGDLMEAKVVADQFATLTMPHHHLLGNHDVAKLSVEENEEILGCSLRSWSFDAGGFHLVLFNADSKLDQTAGLSLRQSDIEWLKADLAAATLPTIIFSHVPLDNGSMKGNFYFDKAYPHHAKYPEEQGEAVREVIERSEKVVMCVNGHAHWNAYHCIDGIHYVTIPSLTETFPTYPLVCESWALLTLEADRAELTVLGNLPIAYTLPFKKKLDAHWLNIHKPYAPQVSLPR